MASGALGGAAIGLKPTVAPIGMPLGLLILRAHNPSRHTARLVVFFVLAAIGTPVLIVVGQYPRSLGQAEMIASNVLEFMRGVSAQARPSYAAWFAGATLAESGPVRLVLLAPVLVPTLYLAGGSRQ